MRLQVLVAALNAGASDLAEKMNLRSDAIIINQCGRNAYEEFDRDGSRIRCYSFAERGVGLSRNNALLRADGDICLFSDEDIVYRDDYVQSVLDAFETYPDADMLLFNMDVASERATYHTERKTRVRLYNSGRYPTYSFAARTKRLHQANLTFSLLFGGGARYSNGEDSLFLRDCLRKGLRIYALPVTLGREVPRQSTWFQGYTEKFFFDRGVLYAYLYGPLDTAMALRFLWRHKDIMCQEIPWPEAFRLMRAGIKEGRR